MLSCGKRRNVHMRPDVLQLVVQFVCLRVLEEITSACHLFVTFFLRGAPGRTGNSRGSVVLVIPYPPVCETHLFVLKISTKGKGASFTWA